MGEKEKGSIIPNCVKGRRGSRRGGPRRTLKRGKRAVRTKKKNSQSGGEGRKTKLLSIFTQAEKRWVNSLRALASIFHSAEQTRGSFRPREYK